MLQKLLPIRIGGDADSLLRQAVPDHRNGHHIIVHRHDPSVLVVLLRQGRIVQKLVLISNRKGINMLLFPFRQYLFNDQLRIALADVRQHHQKLIGSWPCDHIALAQKSLGALSEFFIEL